MPNTRSFYIKSEAFQVIALETEEFEPEIYEIPFIIPIFEKNVTKKKIFEEKGNIVNNNKVFLLNFLLFHLIFIIKEMTQASMILLKNGCSINFVTSGLDLDGKTLDLTLFFKEKTHNFFAK